MKRSIHLMSSDIGVPLGVVRPKATASGPELRTNPIQFESCPIERFIPCDALPAWILVAFGARSLQWVELTLLVVDDLRCSKSFHAERFAGWVFRVWFLANETSLARDHNRTAT